MQGRDERFSVVALANLRPFLKIDLRIVHNAKVENFCRVCNFNYLLWDKKVRSFQIKRKIYYHKSEAYLPVICYKERDVLPDLAKAQSLQC